MITAAIILFLIIFLLRCYNKLSYKICTPSVFMIDKVIIVTGANTGIGFQTAKDLAGRGARVILACRNERKGIAARDAIVSQTGNPNVIFRKLDLSSLASVREFAKITLETEDRLDVLINNAGVYGLGDSYTKDNILEGLQTNHFGPFLLTILLLPLLQKSAPSRIVIVSSILHFVGEINVDFINKKGHYNSFCTYSNGKLCNALFAAELSRRLEGTGVVANAVHPGIIMTNIAENSGLVSKIFWAMFCWWNCKTVEEGAQTLVYLAIARECANVSGSYFVDCEKARTLGVVKNHKVAADLWKLSEELVGCKFVANW